MDKKFLLKLLIVVFSSSVSAQIKVANFSTGKLNTDTYEHLSFWQKDGKSFKIEYSYGAKPKEIKLKLLGQIILYNKKWLKVQFPNQYILSLNVDGTKIIAKDETGNYFKVYNWEYEGPVNGIGTFCIICAENEVEAIEIVKAIYLE